MTYMESLLSDVSALLEGVSVQLDGRTACANDADELLQRSFFAKPKWSWIGAISVEVVSPVVQVVLLEKSALTTT